MEIDREWSKSQIQSTTFYCMGPQLRVLFMFLKGFKKKKVKKEEEEKEEERRI